MAAKHIEGVQGLTVKLYQTETEFNRWHWLRDAGADADIEFVPDPALHYEGDSRHEDEERQNRLREDRAPIVSARFDDDGIKSLFLDIDLFVP